MKEHLQYQSNINLPYLGKMKKLGKLAHHLLIIGPQCKHSSSGPCFFFGFSFLLTISIFFCIAIIPNLPTPLNFMALFLSIQPIMAYLITAFKNPGIATLQQQQQNYSLNTIIQDDQNSNYCRICKIFVRNRTIHCNECDVCILEMDHHCPWIGKCVGKKNYCMFNYFLCSLFAFIIGSSILSVYHK